MDRNEIPFSRRYNKIRLNKKAVLDIIDVLHKQYSDLNIVAGEYRLSSESELNDIPYQTIYNLNICAYNPYISIDFNKQSASIYIANREDVVALGLLQQINNILDENKVWWLFLVNGWFVGSTFLIWCIFLILDFKSIIPQWLSWITWAIYTISFLCTCLTKKTIIKLNKEPSGVINSLEKYSPQVIIAIISAIFGAVIKWALDKYFG